MQVFKLTLRIVNRSKTSVIVYMGVFIFIAVFMSKVNVDDGLQKEYMETSVPFCVIDRDDSELSKALTGFLAENHKRVDLPDDEERLRDELFYRTVEYVLFIPKGFEEELLNGGNPTLNNVKVPGSYTGTFIDHMVDGYVGSLRLSMMGGYSKEDGVRVTNENMKVATKVNVLEKGSYSGVKPNFSYYFDYMAYILIALMILVIGSVLKPFFQKDLRRRNLCSSMKFTSMNGWLLTACMVVGLGMFALLNAIGVLLYYKDDVFWNAYPYYLANGFCISLIGLGLGFCSGMVAKSSNALSGISNTFSLGFAFLGGVFVPQEIMSKGVLNFSRFLPSYWYIRVNNWILEMEGQGISHYLKMWKGMGIQFGFAVAIFAIGLVMARKRMEEV